MSFIPPGVSTAINGVYIFMLMTDKEKVCTFDGLYRSEMVCKRGVVWKDSVASYHANRFVKTVRLKDRLLSGDYSPKPGDKFLVYEPKVREIMSIKYEDRVFERRFNDDILYPIMTRSFIYDNMACQRGGGTDKTLDRLNCHLQRQFRKSEKNFYVLQCDIHHYYQTMPHNVTEDLFLEKISDEWSREQFHKIIETFEGDVGFNPGSQTIQIAGISFLDRMDHMIKEQLRIKGYIRYMDDFILIHESREYLEYCLEVIKEYLAGVGLSLNKKTRIYPVTDGIPFLGFHFFLTDTGKVIRKIKHKNVSRERRRLRKLVEKAKAGQMTRREVDQCYQSWKAHAERGNTRNLIRHMDQYYQSLWR